MAVPQSVEKFVELGGNTVDAATNHKVRDFVKDNGGHTVITRVLIANNGIAAVKEIRSVRQWAYATFGDERAIEFVVMATPEDLKVNAEYIRMADQYVEVPGGTNNNNYANVELIVDVAERTGAHAVWAGWGHASENPLLPESLRDSKSKIVFIGPPGSAMRSLGDKISSTIVAQHAKVPTMPWSGDGITDTLLNDQGHLEVPENAYHEATTHNMEEGLKQAQRIGFPVMVKASEGGGGKGIRMVSKEEDFSSSFQQVLAEVPGSPVFIMKLAGESRHLEVQVLADQYGNAISLFGRDCSVQRRHQKIIEEAPVSIAGYDKFEQMEKAAVRLAKLVGYVSAGTVEYLYTPADDQFYFLELNPRLQVEHPTTEMVSGVNLPAAQLLVAMGIPLHRIRDIRLLYGMDPNSESAIDFEFESPQAIEVQRKPQPKGHVIAVRITAENPEAGFKPSSGVVQSLNFRSSTNVWGYFSVSANGGLHEFADSQFGHIFAYGANREQARQSMVVALKEISIRGDFRTTVEYLVRLLEMPDFKSNTFTTAWLDRLISTHLTADRPDPELAVICGAACMAQNASARLLGEFKTAMDRGQAPTKELLKTTFLVEFIYEGVRYRFIANRTGPTGWILYLNGSKVAVGVRPLSDGGLLVLLDGKSHACYTSAEVGATRLLVDERTCLLEEEVDPTQLRSPSPGKLVRFLVDSGDHVKCGEAYAEIEVMKMYMQLTTSEDGVVQFVKQTGSALAAGEVIGVLTLDDPSKVKHAKPFEGQLSAYGPPHLYGTKTHQLLRCNLALLANALDGYDTPVPAAQLLQQVKELLQKPELPFLEVGEVLSALNSRLPQRLSAALNAEVARAQLQQSLGFPAREMLAIIGGLLSEVSPAEALTLASTVEPITKVLHSYEEGLAVHERDVFISLLQRYIDIESVFSSSANEEEGFFVLRDKYRDEPDVIVDTMVSHAGVASKNKIVMAMLDVVHPVNPVSGALDARYEEVLKLMTGLSGRATSKVALKAREVLLQCQVPSLEERKRQMEHILKSSVTETVYGSGEEYRTPSYDAIRDLVVTNYYVFDVLQSFLYHDNPYVRLAALEVYVRRAYHMYNLVDFDYATEDEAPFMVHWRFILQDDSSGMFAGRIGKNSSVSDLKRIMSVSDLHFAVDEDADPEQYLRQGAMASYDTFAQMEANFGRLLGLIHGASDAASRPESPGLGMRPLGRFAPMSALTSSGTTTPALQRAGSSGASTPLRGGARFGHVVNVALQVPQDDPFDDDTWSERLRQFTASQAVALRDSGIRRLTYVLQRAGQHPGTFTFRENMDYGEDKTIRHVEPGLAYQLELPRLSNFDIRPCFNDNRQLHIYHGVSKDNSADSRFFVRVLVRPGRLSTAVATVDYLVSETDRLLNDILDALEILSAEYPNCDCNHLFISFLPIFNLDASQFEPAYRGFLERHGKRLFRLRVTAAEIRFLVQTGSEEDMPTPFRFCIFNKSGFVPKLENYIEVRDAQGEWVFESLDSPVGSYNGLLVATPHQPKEWLQPLRQQAHIKGTTYVYDFPDLFQHAVAVQWARVAKLNTSGAKPEVPKQLMISRELVWDEATQQLLESDREAGRNSCGMVGFILTLFTPEAPQGRRIVVVANDITNNIGSFGVEEDAMFFRVTQYARTHGLPRIYLSANSGARIGLANEVRELFRTSWCDPSDPSQGFEYLYLTPEDYAKLETREDGKVRSVITEPITMEDGEVRHRLLTIVGATDGLGVENLRGSGMIAGETARAYTDIFTVTLVTCRSVGIGAYLVRLGQRSIQNEGHPIILTGAQPLNKVLGREVYTSNLQLGGTQIMYKNGVSHLTADNDFMGICKIIRWLGYVPNVRGGSLLLTAPAMLTDPVDRLIAYEPPMGPSDPRLFLAGAESEDGWLSGFFDRGSFVETLGGWARTVVTGRARLGGIPMGVIAVEGRTVENVIPADPANPNSEEQVLQEAGTVWYPNSAYKTAQAIQDFNNGEQLPLMIFANWRGFSGGQRDMFFEILKYGAYIVDALTKYKQPVFVYIVPNGELRGGAWVVVDPTINPDMMEMYADTKSRGGVLEPEGIVEIKFRKPQLLACMERLDPEVRDLRLALGDPQLSPEEKAKVKRALEAREKELLPVYMQIAVQFADLHDRAGRMVAKGVIRKELQWPEARSFFYNRVKRRLAEEEVRKAMVEADASVGRDEQTELIAKWFAQTSAPDADYEDDSVVAAWFEEKKSVEEKLAQWKTERHAVCVAVQVAEASDDALFAAIQGLSAERREQLLAKLQQQ